MTREELQETYSKLSTQELLEIIDRKFDYTETAYVVAIEEISKRNVSEKDIENYKIDQTEKAEKFIKANIIDDLTLLQKNFFFFIWIPILGTALRQNFRDDDYLLKLKQANFYSWFGFISFMLIGFISAIYSLQNLTTLGIWILSFLIPYSLDETFNRQRQIHRLQRVLEKYKRNEQSTKQDDLLDEK